MKVRFTLVAFAVLLTSLAWAAEPCEEAAGQKTPCPKEAERQFVRVTSVIPGGEAALAGIEPGDVVKTYDGKPIHCLNGLTKAKEQAKSDSVLVVLARRGEELRLWVRTGPIGVMVEERLPELLLEKDAVVIPGIGPLGWDRPSSFLASLEEVAKHLGVKKDYTELCGVSGAAFRLHFFDDWCPSSPDPTCGFDCGNVALHALGLVVQELEYDSTDEGENKLRAEFVASLDKKTPVIALDLIQIPEWGVIVGYQKDGQELLCKTYFDRRDGYNLAEKFPWVAFVVREVVAPPSDTENYRRSFEIARDLLVTKKYDRYWSGRAAFEKWIARLGENFDRFSDQRVMEETALANAWIYERLTEDRAQAASYLERVAPVFPKAKAQLEKLAILYAEESRALEEGGQGVVLYPGMMKARVDWTPAMRSKQRVLLKQALKRERQAEKLWREVVGLTSET